MLSFGLTNELWYLSHIGKSLAGARGLNFGWSLNLHPYFVHASNNRSGESAQIGRLP